MQRLPYMGVLSIIQMGSVVVDILFLPSPKTNSKVSESYVTSAKKKKQSLKGAPDK